MINIKKVVSVLVCGLTVIILLLSICGIIIYIKRDIFFPIIAHKLLEGNHYSISGDDSYGNWIIDNKRGQVLEKQGQAIHIEGVDIYSYGKSGFICLHQDTDIITVFLDNHITDQVKKEWDDRKMIYDDNLIFIFDISQLNQKQRMYYDKLKNIYMKYPYMQ